jgi:polyphosphate glucokinase
METLGIDIGGSGIKGAPVNIETGEFTAERLRIPTPSPSTPEAVTDVVAEIVHHFHWSGPVGCTFPAIIIDGKILSAANVDNSWIGVNGRDLISSKTDCPVVMLNDADAAGLAEMSIGAGQGQKGVVMVLTLGTGIGSALFTNGHLVPNTELGHLELDGYDAETRAAERARKAEDLSWKKWGKRLNHYLQHVERLFSPNLFIVGGGVSKKHKKYFKYLDLKTPVIPAQMRNQAGIVGAAMAAYQITDHT